MRGRCRRAGGDCGLHSSTAAAEPAGGSRRPAAEPALDNEAPAGKGRADAPPVEAEAAAEGRGGRTDRSGATCCLSVRMV